MELNFNDIIAGKEAPKPEKAAETVQLKKSDTRARQQSCMIH